ncbi:MAG TPA: glycosyltransferase [Isosphaeraceae bacterium]|jgi:glycosyltransferase involved in cell wall biosynthesis|nr:glycosyltransferase [Isosphaeraceae bacterium]
MRIGIDTIALQGWDRRRGIGRYCAGLLDRLLPRDRSVQYVLYTHEDLPTDLIPGGPNVRRRDLRRDPARGERQLGQPIDRIARENPDGLDLLLLLSPFDQAPGYAPPARPLGELKLAAVVYDLIPFLFPERYLDDPGHAARFYRHLERLRRYDALLCISEATRLDLDRLLGLALGRATTIGTGCDPAFSEPVVDADASLEALGLDGPFVFALAGMDERKNWRGTIDAFALLPDRLRSSHRLVMTTHLTDEYRAKIEDHAKAQGVLERILLTGGVDDGALRALYRSCAAFCFPSQYEGFGLPIVEALASGAAVVAGNNSSQPEVVGDAGFLVDAEDPADLAAALTRLLDDRSLADSLRARGPARAVEFTWERTAGRALDAIRKCAAPSSRRLRADRPHGARPRLAVFSPFPPKNSGISDYIARLIDALKDRYAIDLYHEPGYVPEPAIAAADFGSFDFRLFDRNAAQVPYRGVLYQMGNSHYHKFIYETMLRRPGVVTLHDFGLSGFQWWYAHQPGVSPGHFEREVVRFDPEGAEAILPQLPAWDAEPGNMQEACLRRGVYLNRAVFEAARRVVVHSPWCVAEVRRLFPEHESKTAVVPMGGAVVEVAAEARAATRARFGLPADAVLFGSFGILHMNKMNVEAIEAFATIAAEVPAASLVFVGQDLGHGEARRRAFELGLADRVRFLGRQPAGEFAGLIGAMDVGVSLRLPPTNGETSAALLDMLGRGLPTIVTDVATFSGYPDSAVRKVRWDADGPSALAAALRELARDAHARATLGDAAKGYVRDHHSWQHAAALYADVIESAARDRPRAGASGRDGRGTTRGTAWASGTPGSAPVSGRRA